MSRNVRRPATAGFTLLEVLVAITLLSILFLVMAGGLRFGTRVWEMGEAHLDRQTDVQLAYEVMRRIFAEALPMSGGVSGTEENFALVGAPDGVRVVGPPPARSLEGGLFDLDVVTDTLPGRRRLVLVWRPLNMTKLREPVGGIEDGAEEQVLLDNILSARFLFLAPALGDKPAEWRTEWNETDIMPRLIRVEVAFPPGDPRVWPGLVVAPKAELPFG